MNIYSFSIEERTSLFYYALAEMRQHNPFGLYNKVEDCYFYFSSPAEAYLSLLNLLKSRFKRGYIDLAVFLVDFRLIDYSEALSALSDWKSEFGIYTDFLYLHWDELDGADLQQLKTFMACMLKHYEIPFEPKCFEYAIEKFSKSITNEEG